jgi:hypothetical protein
VAVRGANPAGKHFIVIGGRDDRGRLSPSTTKEASVANHSRTTFKKRQKELVRIEKQREKAARRMQRNREKDKLSLDSEPPSDGNMPAESISPLAG